MRTSFTTVLLLAAAVCHAVPTSYGDAVDQPAAQPSVEPVAPVAAPADSYEAPPPTTAPATDSYGAEPPTDSYGVAPPAEAPATDSYGAAPPSEAPATESYGASPTTAPAAESYGAAPPASTDATGAAPPTATDAYGADVPAEASPATNAYGAEPSGGAAPENKLGEPVYSAAPKQYKCSVSDKGFEPKEMTATKGDTVMFQMSEGGDYSIRKGKDASSCEPLGASPSVATGADASSPMSMVYTVPMNATTGKMNFYNIKGDKCVEGDMMATLTIQDNLVANTTISAGNSTTNGTSIGGIKLSSAASHVPMVALVGAISFVGAFVQL